jgi:hypothetical protein
MLANVVESYLDSLEEREFDAPFMALLRALGFWDIHLLHGPFEFGKDFIAKGEHEGSVAQFAFQTKAGDINLSDWNHCRGQIDLLRTNSLAHPAFDLKLPRQAVFVTTGRLVGGAPLEAQDYAQRLQQLGEIGFVVWDKEKLIHFISHHPEIGLAGASEGALLTLLGNIDQSRVWESAIEDVSRRWFSKEDVFPLHKAALEAAVIANRLRRHDRLDLACFVSLCLVRAAWVQSHGAEPVDSTAIIVAEAGRGLFLHYASDLFARCSDGNFDALTVIQNHQPAAAHVTYPTRCLRLIEIVGLIGLLKCEQTLSDDKRAVEFLRDFLQTNPGGWHPISDRWAVSLIPPVLLLATEGYRSEVQAILENVIRWIGNHYEGDNLGLAGPHSAPAEEISYFIGSPFEHVNLPPRRSSYVATVVLDLAAILKMNEVFELAVNDFLAVKAMPTVVEVGDTPGQYVLNAEDIRSEPNMQYCETWAPVDEWKLAPHHKRGPLAYYLQRIGRPWDHLAVSAVLRDRHFLPTCRAFLFDSR